MFQEFLLNFCLYYFAGGGGICVFRVYYTFLMYERDLFAASSGQI